jgi:hypothetical protein
MPLVDLGERIAPLIHMLPTGRQQRPPSQRPPVALEHTEISICGVLTLGRPPSNHTRMSKGLLSHDEILVVRAAVISARLSESRAALLAGLPVELVASIARTAAPGEQILIDLDTSSSVTVRASEW